MGRRFRTVAHGQESGPFPTRMALTPTTAIIKYGRFDLQRVVGDLRVEETLLFGERVVRETLRGDGDVVRKSDAGSADSHSLSDRP